VTKNVALFAWYSVLPSLVIWSALQVPRACRIVQQVHRRLSPSPPSPAGVPIERLAADLRRLRQLLEDYGRGSPAVPVVRRRATQLAYEDLLAAACAALEVPHRLAGTTGIEHDAEVLRVEAALADAGLRILPVSG
jgi:hypothetical protein